MFTQNQGHKYSSQLCHSSFNINLNSSFGLPYGVWEKKRELGVSQCILVSLVLKLLVHPRPQFFPFSVFFLLKFEMNLEVPNYHPCSAAKTMKKGRNMSNDP